MVHCEIIATRQREVSGWHPASGNMFEREDQVVAGHRSYRSLSGKENH